MKYWYEGMCTGVCELSWCTGSCLQDVFVINDRLSIFCYLTRRLTFEFVPTSCVSSWLEHRPDDVRVALRSRAGKGLTSCALGEPVAPFGLGKSLLEMTFSPSW